jgi:hypothetical protein
MKTLNNTVYDSCEGEDQKPETCFNCLDLFRAGYIQFSSLVA